MRFTQAAAYGAENDLQVGHREERSDVAIHAGRMHGLPRPTASQ